MRSVYNLVCILGVLWASFVAHQAHAEFIVSSAILEFTAHGPTQQDIELVSRSDTSDYIVSDVSAILDAGLPSERRKIMDDPSESGLLVTPDKTVLAPGARKVLRFVLLTPPDAQERIYRVTVKPVIKGAENPNIVGLKVLVGYEVLVIVRPAAPAPRYSTKRNGHTLSIANTGNTNVLFQHGRQCEPREACDAPPVVRVYPGQETTVQLPLDRSVDYSVWDGSSNNEMHIE